jgi:signal peptidase I
MSASTVASHPRPWPSAIWGGFLSLILPGLGQVYARYWSLGLILFGINLAAEVALSCFTRLRPFPFVVAVAVALLAVIALLHLVTAADAVRRVRRATQLPRPTWLHSTWLAFLTMVVLSGAIRLLLPFGWHAFNIPAGSMMPTLMVGDYLFADDLAAGSMPERGSVVLFKYPRDNTTDYIKRVIGLPGDRIQMRGGQLVING